MKETAYLIQATLIFLWWIGLYIDHSFFAAFQYPKIGAEAFNAFMLPDLLVIGLLSIIRAYIKLKTLDYVILGGFGFAALYCINATLLTGGGYLPTTIMTIGLFYNVFIVSGDSVFRQSASDNPLINSIKTLIQIICVWSITLLVFPVILLKSFNNLLIPAESLQVLPIALLALFSILGLYSAFVMVKYGNGTPLPLDQTNELVTNGPYKYVRNPMAIAGLGQGTAISIYYSSIHIFIYVILGAILWQFVVRPLEEKDMIKRFGEDYLRYKEEVKCWIPKF